MNKEEFKAIILEQIQNPESAIHLYLHPDDNGRPKNTNRPILITDTAKKYVFCSEFDLRIDVVCSMDERRKVNYQVSFNEIADTVQRNRFDKFIDMTHLKNDSILCYKETVELGICSLIFCLKPYRLTIRDYVFFAEEARNDIVLEADVHSKKFLSFNIDVSRYLWNKIKDGGRDIQYIHFAFTDSECSEITSFLNRLNIKETEINTLKNILSNIRYSPDASGLGQVVKELRKQLGYTIS